MWNHTDSVLIERNLVINCNRAAALGASWYDDATDHVTAVNNVVVYDDPDPRYRDENTFDIGMSVTDGVIAHNTVWNPAKSPDYAFAVCKTSITFANNLYATGSVHRCASQKNNQIIADSTWFRSVGAFDFRLRQNRTVPSAGITFDITGATRSDPPSAGAFEYRTAAVRGQQIVTRRRTNEIAAGSLPVYDIAGRRMRFTDAGQRAGLRKTEKLPAGVYLVKPSCGTAALLLVGR
jgi:hypothetical protein